MKIVNLIAIALLSCLGTANAGLYRCEVDGKIVFQDRACSNAKTGGAIVLSHPTAKSAPPLAAAASNSAQATAGKPTPQQITDDWMASQAREQAERKRQRKINALTQEREALVKAMEAELAHLLLKKTAALNNLAGATYEQSISSEMQAVTTGYDTRIRAKDEELKQLREAPSQP